MVQQEVLPWHTALCFENIQFNQPNQSASGYAPGGTTKVFASIVAQPQTRKFSMDEAIKLAVNGTLMRGLELNNNLLNVGATFLYEATTVPHYRLWSINDVHPAMLRVHAGGTAIALEVWAVPPNGLIQVLLQEPPGLCIGKVSLNTGEEVLGVLGEPILCEGQKEITAHGGWRAYIASQAKVT
jgi:hypothetical protein